MTLFGGNLGLSPPPTKAMMLVLYRSSTMPIPPSNSISALRSSLNFTSVECVFEREGIEDAEAVGRSDSEAALILVEADEQDLFLGDGALCALNHC